MMKIQIYVVQAVRKSTEHNHHKVGGQTYQPFPNPIDDLP